MLFKDMHPFHAHGDTVVLHVRVQPKSRHEGFHGVIDDGQGLSRLKVSVHAAPCDGQANLAVARLIAKALGVAPSSVQLIRGPAQRDKSFVIQTPLTPLLPTLEQLCLDGS
ncbi:MAG: DUF167 domain-containing protein [Chlamydiia bacterium]